MVQSQMQSEVSGTVTPKKATAIVKYSLPALTFIIMEKPNCVKTYFLVVMCILFLAIIVQGATIECSPREGEPSIIAPCTVHFDKYFLHTYIKYCISSTMTI